MIREQEVEEIVAAVKLSGRYRHTHDETIRWLAIDALRKHRKPKAALKSVRRQLHHIMAPYLGDPDYETAGLALAAANGRPEHFRAVSREIMAQHLSTRERLPLLDSFYRRIFAVTGRPRRLIDLACGLNPLAIPWMDLSPDCHYWAYDIHQARVAFFSDYFALTGIGGAARLQDIALEPPSLAADVAFLLKELPRLERNYPGAGRRLLPALDVRYLVISFPTVSARGGRSLVRRYTEFFDELATEHHWTSVTLMFEGELVFVADKQAD